VATPDADARSCVIAVRELVRAKSSTRGSSIRSVVQVQRVARVRPSGAAGRLDRQRLRKARSVALARVRASLLFGFFRASVSTRAQLVADPIAALQVHHVVS
jgi:hypothetical protein